MSSSPDPSGFVAEIVASDTSTAQSTPSNPTSTQSLPADHTLSLPPIHARPTGYGGGSSDDDDIVTGGERDHGVLNYYFLLLAVLIILILVIWFAILRRRRKKALQFHFTRQTALARDVQGWGGASRFAPGRWRTMGAREPRPEEGLDDRGEAPPPYIPNEPAAAHTRRAGEGGRDSIELRDRSREEAKPPEYR